MPFLIRIILAAPAIAILAGKVPIYFISALLALVFIPNTAAVSWILFISYLIAVWEGLQNPWPSGIYFTVLPILGEYANGIMKRTVWLDRKNTLGLRRAIGQWWLGFGAFITSVLAISLILLAVPPAMPEEAIPLAAGGTAVALAFLRRDGKPGRARGIIKARLVLGNEYSVTEGPGTLSIESRGVPLSREVVIPLRTAPISDYVTVYSHRELKRLPRVYESELNRIKYIVYSNERPIEWF